MAFLDSATSADPAAPPSAQPLPPDQAALAKAVLLAKSREATAANESADWAAKHGDNGYGAIGPTTSNGDFAVGRYGVMKSNVADWTKAATGTAYNWQDFLHSPSLQDTVYNHRMGGYLDKYGPAGAANAWFSGSPNTPANKTDGYHSVGNYVSNYLKNLAGGGSALPANSAPTQGPAPPMQAALQQPAPQQAPQQPLGGPGGPLEPFDKAAAQYPQSGSVFGFGGPDMGNKLQRVGAWLLAANNPGAAASMLGAVNQGAMGPMNAQLARLKALQGFAPTFGQTGVDMLGHNTFGYIPSGLAMMYGQQSGATPGVGVNSLAAQGSQLPGLGGGAPGSGNFNPSMGTIQAVGDAYQRGGSEAALAAVPQILRPLVQDYAMGGTQATDLDRGTKTYIALLAHQAYPGMTDTQFKGRGTFANQLNSGQPNSIGGQITSANAMVAHSGEALDYLDALNSDDGHPTDVGAAVPGMNSVRGRVQMGEGSQASKDYSAYMQTVRGLVGEYEKFMSAGNPSFHMRADQLDVLDPNVVGPTQAETNLREMVAQMYNKMGGIAATRNMNYNDRGNVPQPTGAVRPDGTKNLLTYEGKLDNMDFFGAPQQKLLKGRFASDIGYASKSEQKEAPKAQKAATKAGSNAENQLDAARKWLAANPNDPRAASVAARIKQLSGQ